MSEEREEWRRSPSTKKLLKDLKTQRATVHQQLLQACRESTDPKVARWMGYYDCWTDSFAAATQGAEAMEDE